MSNYVQMLNNPRFPLEKEDAENVAESLKENSTIDENGVIRWTTNDQVPPNDIVDFAVYLGYEVNVENCNVARDEDMVAVFEAYRKNQSKQPTAEERYEARAAFGPGHTIVNVITGRKFTT